MPDLPAAPIGLYELSGCGHPHRPAITYRSDTLTYGELADQVAAVAGGLQALGVQSGERVVVWAEKRLETVVTMLAVSALGAVVVPVNPQYRARQVAYVVADCSAAVIVTTPQRLDTLGRSLRELDSVRDVVLIGDADLVSAGSAPDDATPTITAWTVLPTHAPAPGAAVTDQDIAAIFYTSGSTGGPKGVVLSHRNLLAGAQSVAGYLGHTDNDRILAVLPLSFDAGFSQLTASLIAGAHVVLVNYLTAREVVRLCAKHAITGLTCVPPLWLQLVAADWTEQATTSLRYFANTGGRMPRATLTRLRALFAQAEPFLMYGLTEAFRSTYLDPAEVDRRPDSIGKAIPNVEVLVLRPDGSPCAPGEPGELVHRGPLVAAGYWNDPARTAERFRPVPGLIGSAPAVWSGDTVQRDEDGYLYFVGRTDEMIKTSGYRVSPTEIEEAAYATGLVDEAVAFGVPDERLGQHIVLVVAPACDGELLTKAMAQELPAYMLAKRVVTLEGLPRSVNGKFDRVSLRATLEPTQVPQ